MQAKPSQQNEQSSWNTNHAIIVSQSQSRKIFVKTYMNSNRLIKNAFFKSNALKSKHFLFREIKLWKLKYPSDNLRY